MGFFSLLAFLVLCWLPVSIVRVRGVSGPAMAILEGAANAIPFLPTRAVPLGDESATPPSPATARPLGLA